jgi:hypothetical protein
MECKNYTINAPVYTTKVIANMIDKILGLLWVTLQELQRASH